MIPVIKSKGCTKMGQISWKERDRIFENLEIRKISDINKKEDQKC